MKKLSRTIICNKKNCPQRQSENKSCCERILICKDTTRNKNLQKELLQGFLKVFNDNLWEVFRDSLGRGAGNRVLPIQKVPSAVWRPQYQSAFYVSSAFIFSITTTTICHLDWQSDLSTLGGALLVAWSWCPPHFLGLGKGITTWHGDRHQANNNDNCASY